MQHLPCHHRASVSSAEWRLLSFGRGGPESQNPIRVAPEFKSIDRLHSTDEHGHHVRQRVDLYQKALEDLEGRMVKLGILEKHEASFDRAAELLDSVDSAGRTRVTYSRKNRNKLSRGESIGGAKKIEKVFYRLDKLETLYSKVERIIGKLEGKLEARGAPVEKSYEEKAVARADRRLEQKKEAEDDTYKLRTKHVDNYDKPFTSVDRRACHTLRLPAGVELEIPGIKLVEGNVGPRVALRDINGRRLRDKSGEVATTLGRNTGNVQIVEMPNGMRLYKLSPKLMDRVKDGQKAVLKRGEETVGVATLRKSSDGLNNIIFDFAKAPPKRKENPPPESGTASPPHEPNSRPTMPTLERLAQEPQMAVSDNIDSGVGHTKGFGLYFDQSGNHAREVTVTVGKEKLSILPGGAAMHEASGLIFRRDADGTGLIQVEATHATNEPVPVQFRYGSQTADREVTIRWEMEGGNTAAGIKPPAKPSFNAAGPNPGIEQPPAGPINSAAPVETVTQTTVPPG